ncbi:MAG TPA: hypothetical protein VJ961_05255 [Mariprofundaceae bacterium]|nr:hypothetical protein [Mariprofundaceae bacterium]
MKRLIVVVMGLLASTSVAQAGTVINAAPVKVYQAAEKVALDLGAMPSVTNDTLMYFKTDPVTLKPTAKQCDCGSMFGIPYVKDSRTMANVSYKVIVKAATKGDSEIDVTTSIDGYYDESRNSISNFMSDKRGTRSKTLDCKSTGAFEAAFIRKVKGELSNKK